jgi:diguanylate cyclase (GGDEF)-like protein
LSDGLSDSTRRLSFKIASMLELVNNLAQLSALRDREALDFALVNLVKQCSAAAFTSTRLMRVVGELHDRRWHTCARLDATQLQPEHVGGWVEWSTLARLQDEAHCEACLVSSTVLQPAASNGLLTLFPIGPQDAPLGVLELQGLAVLPAETLAVLAAILRLYFNLQGLLDYGEKDALTELLNRKTFDRTFFKASYQEHPDHPPGEINRRAGQTGGYWLVLMDIDHFKNVNDTYGHLIGDEVLVLFARLMRSSFRFHDQLYRFGGEEFVVLMRCNGARDAHAVVERFRQSVQTHAFPQVGRITVSIGYAPLENDDTPSAGFGRVDQAVYYAKQHGRNQVCSYTELVASGALSAATPDTQEIDFFD